MLCLVIVFHPIQRPPFGSMEVGCRTLSLPLNLFTYKSVYLLLDMAENKIAATRR